MRTLTVDEFLKVLSILGLMISFFWGVYQWRSARAAMAQQAQLDGRALN